MRTTSVPSVIVLCNLSRSAKSSAKPARRATRISTSRRTAGCHRHMSPPSQTNSWPIVCKTDGALPSGDDARDNKVCSAAAFASRLALVSACKFVKITCHLWICSIFAFRPATDAVGGYCSRPAECVNPCMRTMGSGSFAAACCLPHKDRAPNLRCHAISWSTVTLSRAACMFHCVRARFEFARNFRNSRLEAVHFEPPRRLCRLPRGPFASAAATAASAAAATSDLRRSSASSMALV